MTILEMVVSPQKGTELIGPEIVAALSQEGVVDYWVETKGLFKPRIRRLHLVLEKPYDPDRDGTIETLPTGATAPLGRGRVPAGPRGEWVDPLAVIDGVRVCCKTAKTHPHNPDCPYKTRR